MLVATCEEVRKLMVVGTIYIQRQLAKLLLASW
jgi:hypothetical protein